MIENRFALPDDPWNLRFTLLPGAPDGELLILRSEDGLCIRIIKEGEAVSAQLDTQWSVSTARYGDRPLFTYRLDAPHGGHEFTLVWNDGPSVCLYADDSLIDEDWPLGCPSCQPYEIIHMEGVADIHLTAGPSGKTEQDTPLSCPAQFYMPPWHNASVGDCMPFAHNGHYRLFHLFDRRHHRSKQGLGAHQWAQISSRDLRSWTLHPITISIDEQWEGSICTGSMIEHEGKVYAFYAVRMSDGSPAKLTWAVSEDGVHFVKSGLFFTLSAPYEPVSARDPKVFRDADGLYHMLVTTSIMDGSARPGCLAHLTSPNLIDWTQHEPLLVPGYPGQPECSDYFEWNGRYYIVFANNLNARYRISDHPFGPWRRPADDILVSPNLAVPKTAFFGQRNLVSGWLGDGGWGGWALTYELIQRADGSLGVRYIEEMMPELTVPALPPVSADASRRYAECPMTECADAFRIRGTLTLDQPDAVCEIILSFDVEEYRIAFDPLEKTVSFHCPKERPLDVNGRSRLINVEGLDEPFDIDLIVYHKILMLLLPDGRLLLPARLNHSGACRLTLACRDGKAEFTPRS